MKGANRAVTMAMVCEAGTMIIYSIVPHAAFSLLVILFWGIVTSQLIVPYYSILQSSIAEEYLGRTLAVLKQLEGCGITLAMVLAAALVESLGSHIVLLVGGTVYLIAASGLALTRSGKLLLART